MSPLNLACLLGVVALVVYFATKGAPALPGRSVGRDCLRKHKRAVEDAQAKAIDAAADEAAARILGPVPSYTAPAAPEPAAKNG